MPARPAAHSDLNQVLADATRIRVLRGYDQDGLVAWGSLDRVVELAKGSLKTSCAAVSLIDGQREVFKAVSNFHVTEVAVAHSIGAQALILDDILIPDALQDDRFRGSPLVAQHGLRFYGAAVIRANCGQSIGTVCVMDYRPREGVSRDRLRPLHSLARLVEAELERQLLAERLHDAEQRLRDMAEVSSDLAWATDAEHRFANFDTQAPGMAPLRSYALGKHRWDFRDSRPLKGTWQDHIQILNARREFRDFEYELVTSLGEYRAMRISGRPAYDRRGSFLGYRGLSADITAQKQQERQLAASEAKYRSLVESMVDVVFATDDAGKLTYVSGASKAVLGAEPHELVGRSFISLIHRDHHEQLRETARNARLTPDRINSLVARGGAQAESMRHVEVRFRATGAADTGGQLVFGGIIRDVEARTQMELRQHDDMMKLRSIIESSGALILLVDRDLRVVLVNHTFAEATGREPEQILGAPFDDVIACNADPEILSGWLAHDQITRLDPVEYDNTLSKPDGAQRTIRVTASPVQDDAGRVKYILFLGVDETARRSAELQLLDAAKLATIGQMATGMAHEVNQPMTLLQFGIEGLVGELEDGLHRDDPEGFADGALERLKRMESQIKRASGIIRSMQGFASRSEKAAASFDLRAAIDGAIDLVAEQMSVAGIDLEKCLPATLPVVAGQANRLQQVLLNLLLNARDAVEEGQSIPGSGRGKIIVRAELDELAGLAKVEVEDNGPGIAKEVLPRLFEPFFTTKPTGKGTGLGLSISSEIARKMGGTLTAISKADRGALFRLTFPLANTRTTPPTDR